MTHAPLDVCLSVDVEEDCPPYLSTFRGIEEGMDLVLALFAEESVRATFFVTGKIAEKYPDVVRRIVSMGHELGSHGHSHCSFDVLLRGDAVRELAMSKEILEAFAPIRTFRAPYLRFPDDYTGLLVDAGFSIDSSQARYKPSYYRKSRDTVLKRVPVSMTSSLLRLPDWIRFPVLHALSSPIVLFVHPWEFVDLTREKLRLDCRFRTGPVAVEYLRSVIRFFRVRQGRFTTIAELAMARE